MPLFAMSNCHAYNQHKRRQGAKTPWRRVIATPAMPHHILGRSLDDHGRAADALGLGGLGGDQRGGGLLQESGHCDNVELMNSEVMAGAIKVCIVLPNQGFRVQVKPLTYPIMFQLFMCVRELT